MRLSTALRASLVAISMAAIAAPAAPFGIGLQPTTVEMTVQPGDRQRQVINLGNVHQEQTISLTLGLADWSLDESGQISLTPPGETNSSAADWVRFSPAFVTLEPGETEQVIVDMAAPIRIDREGDYRFALIASTLLPEERSGQSGVWKKYQIASLFYLTMGNAKSAPEVKAASVSQSADGASEIVLDFENSGNAHARLRGDVEITGDSGGPIIESISNLVVLHEGIRKYRVPLTETLPANPQVKVTLENTFAPQTATGAIMLEPFTSDLSFEETALPAGGIEDAETALD